MLIVLGHIFIIIFIYIYTGPFCYIWYIHHLISHFVSCILYICLKEVSSQSCTVHSRVFATTVKVLRSIKISKRGFLLLHGNLWEGTSLFCDCRPVLSFSEVKFYGRLSRLKTPTYQYTAHPHTHTLVTWHDVVLSSHSVTPLVFQGKQQMITH